MFLIIFNIQKLSPDHQATRKKLEIFEQNWLWFIKKMWTGSGGSG